MKVLITGGSGFIGSHITDRLLAGGNEVLVIDNYRTGRRDNLVPQDNLTIVEGTIADPDLVEEAFASFKPEIVVHAAASYHDPNDWEEDARTNVQGTAVITQAAIKHEARRLIYFQTALCYGLKPMEQPITITHPLVLEGSSYAISKTAGERYIDLSGIDYISFRLANAYGPRNISGPLPIFYQRLGQNKGCFVTNTRRDFIFVSDLVDCVMLAMEGKGKRGAYHISSGTDFAIEELYDETCKAMGLDPKPEVERRERSPEDAATILLDPSKTQKDFDWNVQVKLTDGVAKAIEYYKEFGINETFTHLKHED